MLNQTQKIQYLARLLNITPRTVYKRLKRGELTFDQVSFPEQWVPDNGPVQERIVNLTRTGSEPVVNGPGTGSEGALSDVTDMSPIPDQILNDWKQAMIEVGELRERVKWLSAENSHLTKKIGLLTAPPEEPKQETVIATRPSFSERVRAWFTFTKGGIPAQTGNQTTG